MQLYHMRQTDYMANMQKNIKFCMAILYIFIIRASAAMDLTGFSRKSFRMNRG